MLQTSCCISRTQSFLRQVPCELISYFIDPSRPNTPEDLELATLIVTTGLATLTGLASPVETAVGNPRRALMSVIRNTHIHG